MKDNKKGGVWGVYKRLWMRAGGHCQAREMEQDRAMGLERGQCSWGGSEAVRKWDQERRAGEEAPLGDGLTA